jgi:hypothetical protein
VHQVVHLGEVYVTNLSPWHTGKNYDFNTATKLNGITGTGF